MKAFLCFSCHMALFTLPLLLYLTKVNDWRVFFLHPYPCRSGPPSPPPPHFLFHAQSQKTQTPVADSAHVRGVNLNRGAMVTGHEAAGQGSVSPWGVSRGHLKKPRPQKRKQMAAGMTPTCGLHLFSPLCLYSTSVQRVLWGLWSERMSQWWACPRGVTSQGPCWLQHNTSTADV